MRAALIRILIIGLGIILCSVDVLANGALCILDSTDIEIKNDLTAIVKVHNIIEITSEGGVGLAEISVPVNDFMEIDDIEGYTLLPNGRKIKIKSSDIRTASAAQIREFGGYRVVLINLRSPVIGAELHYEYTLKIKSLLYLPRFIHDLPYDVKRYVVRVRWQNKVGLTYDASGFEIESAENELRFFGDNLPAVISEAFRCPPDYYLLLSADRFKYRKKIYDSETWADVGRFFQTLSKQPEGSLEEIRSLAERITRESTTRADSIRAIFNYVADSVAYVSLELGKSDFDPHFCDLIIKRRFGDCKDQAVLLSSLYNEIGFKANPVLVATGGYPLSDRFHPWPSIFDHVAVALKGGIDEMIILDPSDPYSIETNRSSKLRGKYYLDTDGLSGLGQLPAGPEPSQRISWNFDLGLMSGDSIGCDFALKYYNEASRYFNGIIGGNDNSRLASSLKSMLFQSEWHVSSLEVTSASHLSDTLYISGLFSVRSEYPGSFESLSLGSPILEYLLKIFSGVRSADYCNPETYELEEIVRVDFSDNRAYDIDGFHEVWILDELEFSDELTLDNNIIVYRRVFSFEGSSIPRDEYNAFRDFIFSMRNQRYIRIEE